MTKTAIISLFVLIYILTFNTQTVNAINDITTNYYIENNEYNNDYNEENYENFKSIHSEYVIPFEDEINENENLPEYEQNLTLFDETIAVEDMNEHIKNTAPSDSPFIDRGDMFIEIGTQLSVNPYYIYAHASIESGYGKSNMAISKGNYFGIGAYNSDPSQACIFINNDDVDKVYIGLYNGTKWIKENYFDEGLDSLYKMISGSKKYAVNDDGTPNYDWMYDISYLMNYN